MDFNENQLLALLQLKPDIPPNIDKKKIPPKFDEVVPDLFDEFSNIADTKVFKQPFSLKKYKNLIPRQSQQKKRKQKTQSNKLIKDSKAFRYSSPCSPCLSIDSAIDLSADFDSNFGNSSLSSHSTGSFSPGRSEISNSRLDQESIFTFTISQRNISEEHSNQVKSGQTINKQFIKMKEDNRSQYLKEINNIICIRPKKFKNEPSSLADILLTDLSFPIPIIIENDNVSKASNHLNNEIPLKRCANKINYNVYQNTSINGDTEETHFDETLANMIYSPSKDLIEIQQQHQSSNNNDLLYTIQEELSKGLFESLPTDDKVQYTAIKSSRFVVEDDCEIPLGLFELLDAEIPSDKKTNNDHKITCENIIKNLDVKNNNTIKNNLKPQCADNQIEKKKPSRSFCVSLLHMFSEGILEKSKNGFV